VKEFVFYVINICVTAVIGNNSVCGLWNIIISNIRQKSEVVKLLQFYACILHNLPETVKYTTRLTITKETG
jgi:hypothetical protein